MGFDVLFKSLNVTKKINIFLAHFRFLIKATNFFNATGYHPCSPTSTKISIDILLPAEKNIWPKSSVAYFTTWFQSIFTIGGWRTYPFNLLLLAPAYIPTQSCKRALFWSPNPARVQHLFLKPDLGVKAKFTKGVEICATAEKQKTLCTDVVAGARFITPKIATTLTKTLA